MLLRIMRVISGPIRLVLSYVYRSCIFQLRRAWARESPRIQIKARWDCGPRNISRTRAASEGNILRVIMTLGPHAAFDVRGAGRLWSLLSALVRWRDQQHHWESEMSQRRTQGPSQVHFWRVWTVFWRFWWLSSIINTRLLEDSFRPLAFAAVFLIESYL